MAYSYKSRLDAGMKIEPNNWVLSLVAKAKGKNPKHAFIVVEGLSEDEQEVIFRRYDFVLAEKNSGFFSFT